MIYPAISLSIIGEEWLDAWLDSGFMTQAVYDEEIERRRLLEKADGSILVNISDKMVKSDAYRFSLR
jgi:hypothetical protein